MLAGLFALLTAAGLVAAQVGMLTKRDDDPRQWSPALWPPGLQLSVERLDWWGPLGIVRAVCRLSRGGARSLVALAPAGEPLSSTAAALRLPLLDNVALVPDPVPAAADLVRHYGWRHCVFLYHSQRSADQLQKLVGLLNSELLVEGFWRFGSAEEAAKLLQRRRPLRLLLAAPGRLARELLHLLPSADTHVLLLRPVIVGPKWRRGGALVTELRLTDDNGAALSRLEESVALPPRRNDDLPESVAFSHDASLVLQAAFSRVDRPTQIAGQTDCFSRSPGAQKDGQRVTASIRQVSLNASSMTGPLTFDENGSRTNYSFHIFEVSAEYTKKIGTWSVKDGLKIKETPLSDQGAAVASLTQPQFRVSSVLVRPFLQERPDKTLEGFIVDLVDELAAELGWILRIQVVKDGRYGMLQPDGTWNGMIGELQRNEADFVLAPLTKTTVRSQAVTFTRPFLSFGLSVLTARAKGGSVDRVGLPPFAFWLAWPLGAWLLGALVAAALALATGALARFIGPPERVRALATKDSERLSACSSCWFVTGAAMLRDTGIFPRSLSLRLCAILWWSFTLFLLMAYLSSLCQYLIISRTTVVTTHTQISSHDLVKKFLETGYPVIGTLRSGSTVSFFKNSEIGSFQKLGQYFERHPEVLTASYSEGEERVRKSGGGYAFIMESAASEFAANRPPCDVLAAPGVLNTRTYAVAMRKDSPHMHDMDHALLNLQERGIVRKLYELWWFNSSSSCEDPNLNILPHVYSNSLTLSEVSGVFYVFLAFLVITQVVAVVEYRRRKTISLEPQHNIGMS